MVGKRRKKSIAQRFLAGNPKEQGTFYFDILYRGTGRCIFLRDPGIIAGYEIIRR